MRCGLIAALMGSIFCIVLATQPATGQDQKEATTDSVDGTAATAEGGGTAIVEVVTEPASDGGGTFIVTGTPAGDLALVSGGQGSLTATGLSTGSHVSKLSQWDPAVETAGYELTDIRCDDEGSSNPSIAKLENRAAIFRTEESEMVTCEFVLSKRDVRSAGGSGVECICPREGRWNAQNLEGKMDCKGAFVLNRKLEPVRDNGVILVMEDDCSRLFGDSTTKKEEDVLMTRVDGCGYRGTIEGTEEGIDMVIDVIWTVESQERITGEMTSSTSQMGITCDLYRSFDLTFDKELGEDEHRKWEQRITKKMNQVK